MMIIDLSWWSWCGCGNSNECYNDRDDKNNMFNYGNDHGWLLLWSWMTMLRGWQWCWKTDEARVVGMMMPIGQSW